jgi:uncharacterized protein YraI
MRKVAFWLMAWLAAACLSAGMVSAQGEVRAVVVNPIANIRIVPALGADVAGSVPAGYTFVANGRSPDNEWLRFDFNGEEGWIGVAVLTILSGDVNSLQVADPRTIPYGGFDSPRAGMTNKTSPITAVLVNGVHLRAGPSIGYPILANPLINAVVPVLGRTANSTWVQINFEGSLGWIATRYIELQNGASLASLPIDGVVADSLPISQPTHDDYISTLKLMLARIDLAQPSLDAIRASWTDSALTGRAACHAYPARPSDYNIPNPLLAAFYPTLNPLMTDFNDAMFNVRKAIDLLIEVCNQPGTGNPVGIATVQGALGVVNLADGQFADLRRRLLDLIPPEIQPGPNDCVLTFNGESDILPLVTINTVYLDNFDPKRTTIGACFDAALGQSLFFDVVQSAGNADFFIAVSRLDNPTNFVAVGRGGTAAGIPLIVGPLAVTNPGRYLLIISDAGGATRKEPLTSTFGYAVVNAAGVTLPPTLTVDPTTKAITLAAALLPVGTPGGVATGTPGVSVVCPSLAFTCNQLFTCDEAKACLAAGNFSLDPDNNGIPCGNLCPGG